MTPADQRAFWAEVGRRNFRWFAKWAFGIRFFCAANPGDNWWDEGLHGGLCDDIQLCVEEWERNLAAGVREPMDILIMAFRGFGKSTLGCALDLWLQVRNPNLSERISSFDEVKSIEFLNVNRTVMEGDASYGIFKDLYGVWSPVIEETEWRRDALTHVMRTNRSLRDPSFKTSSVGKGLTGSRPDVFRLDDPVVKEKMRVEGNWILKAREHLAASRFAVKTNGLRIVYLTPYADGDVSAKCLKEEGVRDFLPHSFPLDQDRWIPDGPWRVFFVPAKGANGQPVLPKVYPAKRLEEMERDDPDDFAAQMMCDPISGSHLPLNRGDIEGLWIEKSDLPKEIQISVHCDTAFKDQARRGKGDFNVIQVWGHQYGTGRVFYLGAKRSKEWTGKEFVLHLAETLMELDKEGKWPFVVTDEREMGGKTGMVEEFLKGECARLKLRVPNFLYLTINRTGKEQRIRQTVFAWKTDKVRLVRGAREAEALIYEMCRIGVSAHDDMADAASAVFHPSVWMPEVRGGLGADPTAPVVRPYEQLLWIPPGEWTQDETRGVYDETIGKRLEEGGPESDEEALLGSRVWADEGG